MKTLGERRFNQLILFCFFSVFPQQPRLRFGYPRPRPRFAVAQDHGQGVAAIGAGAVRRDAGQQVQHGRPGSSA